MDEMLVVQDLTKKLQEVIVEVRHRRRPVEQEWLHIHSMWHNKHSRPQYRSKTFSYYIAMGRRTIERSVVRTKQIILPTPAFFEVRAVDDFDAEASQRAASVHAYLDYYMRKRVKVHRYASELVRHLLLYGLACSKTTVEVYHERNSVEIWPRTRTVDPFMYYIYPETALDTEDRLLVFEDHMMPYSRYQALAKAGRVEPIAQSTLKRPEWPDHIQQRLAKTGLSDPSNVPSLPKQNYVALTEAWFQAGGGWWQAWIVWNIEDGPKMVLGPKPSRYGSYPYRDAVARSLAGEYCTNSMGHDVEPLQVWFNDAINQMESARVTSSLPPVAVDRSRLGRADSLQYGERRIWDIPPDAVKQIDIADTSTSSLRVAQVIIGLMNSVTGSSSLMEGQAGRNMPRAGFAVNSLLNLNLADLKDVAEVTAYEILEPTLQDVYEVTKVFVPSRQILTLGGSEDMRAMTITAGQLYGEFAFNWLTSLSSQDSQMRAHKLITFMQTLAQIAPLVQQQGYMIEWADLARLVWKEGLGERGLNRIIRPLTQEEILLIQQQQQQQQQRQPAALPATNEEATRQLSALLSKQMGIKP